MKVQWFADTSIKNKISLLVVTLLLLISSYSLYYFPKKQKEEILSATTEKVNHISNLLTNFFAEGLRDGNLKSIKVGYEVIKKTPGVGYLLIYDRDGSLLMEHNPTHLALQADSRKLQSSLTQTDDYIEKTSEIRADAKIYGHVVLGLSLEAMKVKIASMYRVTSVVLSLVLVISLAITQVMARIITNPLEKITNIARHIAQGDLSKRVIIDQKDEVGQLAHSFNEMMSMLKGKTDEIEGAMEMASKVADEIGAAVVGLRGGDLKIRVEPSCVTGKFREQLETFNSACEAIIVPIYETAFTLQEYARGDFDDVLRDLPGELQILPNSLNYIKSNLEALVEEGVMLTQAFEQGHLKKRGDAEKFKGGYAEIIRGMNQIIENILAPVHEAVGGLKEMASGDFSMEISCNYQGDHAIMKDAMNGTLQSLNLLLGEVAAIVEQVANGTAEVTNSSQSLADGAAKQATSLQQISASVSVIGSQTRQNDENADQANQLARTARDNAEQGNLQMKNMLKAMADIKRSSDEIHKIIKTIDEIAFQTNLLALNAAVEAARAGVHGKGFAVVAEEVRNLAQRSAKAAHETTALIEDSVKRVENGAKIADSTANALDEIVGGIAKVTDLVGEIAEASKEQSTGIDLVNRGLTQVDDVTKANTASAEQSAAAAHKLSDQARILRRMLGKFKLRARDGRRSQELAKETSSARITTVEEEAVGIGDTDRG